MTDQLLLRIQTFGHPPHPGYARPYECGAQAHPGYARTERNTENSMPPPHPHPGLRPGLKNAEYKAGHSPDARMKNVEYISFSGEAILLLNA
jgi:hypothetical protein